MKKSSTYNSAFNLVSRLIFIMIAVFFIQFTLFSQETEPNNTAAEANYFEMNSSITAAIGIEGDEDWFTVTIPEEGILKIHSYGNTINDYYIQLIDVNAESVLSTTEVYPLGDIDSVYKTNLQAGTYYVRVYPYFTNVGS